MFAGPRARELTLQLTKVTPIAPTGECFRSPHSQPLRINMHRSLTSIQDDIMRNAYRRHPDRSAESRLNAEYCNAVGYWASVFKWLYPDVTPNSLADLFDSGTMAHKQRDATRSFRAFENHHGLHGLTFNAYFPLHTRMRSIVRVAPDVDYVDLVLEIAVDFFRREVGANARPTITVPVTANGTAKVATDASKTFAEWKAALSDRSEFGRLFNAKNAPLARLEHAALSLKPLFNGDYDERMTPVYGLAIRTIRDLVKVRSPGRSVAA